MRQRSRLTHAVLGVVILLVPCVALASPPVFPTDAQFAALAKDGELVPDSADGEGFPLDAIDLTGSATEASAFIGHRTGHTFLRLRLDGDPRAPIPPERSWGCFFETDGDPTTYEWSTVVVSGTGADGVFLRRNTSTDAAQSNSASDPPELTVASYPGLVGTNHSRVSQVANDFYLDWAIDWNDAGEFDPTMPMRIHCETGANALGYGYDASVDSVEPYELVNGWSDLMRCDANSCKTTCEGEGEACSAGRGACLDQGTIVCKEGRGICDASPGMPAPETCNGIDEDCNGIVDDALPADGCLCDTEVGRCVDCLTAEDCEAGVCHAQAHVCVACAEDADCGDGRCVGNRCVACASADDCAEGDTCDAATGACVPRPEGCLTTGCDRGFVCNTVTEACEQGCALDSDCGGESLCVADEPSGGRACVDLVAEGRGVLQCGFGVERGAGARWGLFALAALVMRRRGRAPSRAGK